MTTQTFSEIYSPELAKDAIINNQFPGFREDYLTLHCLLRKFKPKSVFEIGTNMGVGTSIICNSVPKAKVYSLDLPTELAHVSLQHPISEGKGDRVGSMCKFPFTQLRGDSLVYMYHHYPCEAYFIDGEHDFQHVHYETSFTAKYVKPKLYIWHDADMEPVYRAIVSALKDEPYTLYRVTDTRIAYAVRQGGSI